MKRQLMIFLIVGLLTVLIDFISYQILISKDLLSINMAKTIGFLNGTLFAYVANRRWTFGRVKHARGSLCRFLILYAITLGVNVMSNFALLSAIKSYALAIPVAFIFATGLSAVLNFLGMNFFVFKGNNVRDLQ